MSDNIQTGDFSGAAVTVRTTETGGLHTPHHRDPEAIATLGDIETAINAVLDKLIATPATEAGQAVLAGHLDGVEGGLSAIANKIIASPATEAKQDTEIAAVNRIGTRAYGTVQRVAVTASTAICNAIAATEVLLHAKGAACYVQAVAATGTPTVDPATAIPLEAGEKFHMRITSGQRIATIRDTADGFLHIAPVA
jgi:hypothetical protein